MNRVQRFTVAGISNRVLKGSGRSGTSAFVACSSISNRVLKESWQYMAVFPLAYMVHL